MALEEGSSGVNGGILTGAVARLRHASVLAARAVALLSALVWPALVWLGERLADTAIGRFVSASLTRRIIVSNIFGLLILLGGYFYLAQSRVWLTDTKLQSLETQAQIIAQAIAANASIENERIVLDPDQLPEVEGAKIPFRDDGFAALELSLRPERIAPVLRRLTLQTSNRARVYDRDGTLIADTNAMLTRGQLTAPESPTAPRPKTRNLWTKLAEFFSANDLPVYKEIGNGNGNLYPQVRSAMNGGPPTRMMLINEERETIVSVAAPILRARHVQGVLLLSNEPGEIDEIMADERFAILKVAILALGATIFASLVLAQTVAGPMRRLSEAAEHVSKSITARQQLPDMSERTDEVGQMATAFTAMTHALYRRLEASEKFAADVAHELKNPLTAARSTAESLAYAKTEEQRAQLVGQIQSELKRLNRLITDVSNASRLDAELALQQNQEVDLPEVLSGIVGTFRDILSSETRKVEYVAAPKRQPDDYLVMGNDSRLGQVITNLIDNAISFSPPDGTVTVRLRRVQDNVEFIVEDQGPGIEPDKLEQIFDRFYTYRPTATTSRGNNSGLGLSISREIVRAHGGEIHARNIIDAPDAKPRGASFAVILPAAHARSGPLRSRTGRVRRA